MGREAVQTVDELVDIALKVLAGADSFTNFWFVGTEIAPTSFHGFMGFVSNPHYATSYTSNSGPIPGLDAVASIGQALTREISRLPKPDPKLVQASSDLNAAIQSIISGLP